MRVLSSYLGVDKTLAQTQIVSEGFTVGTVTQSDSTNSADEADHNKVISQSPVSGSLLDYESLVNITWRNFSFTPAPYSFTPGPYSFTPYSFTPYSFTPYSFTPLPQTLVPNVVGDQSDGAESELQAAGFAVAFAFRTEGATLQNAGYVYSQSPAGGTYAAAGSLVTITVYSYSLNLPTPSLSVSMGPGASGTVYANVTVGNYDYANSYSATGGVTQNPEFPEEWNISGLTPGQSYTVNITASRSGYISSTGSITFTASSGSTPYSFTPYSFTPYSFTPYSFTPYSFTPSSGGTIPNVVGLSLNLALAIISEEGFQNAPSQSYSSVGATAQNDGDVKSQNPAAGTSAPFSTNVQLVVYSYNAAYSFTPSAYSFTPYSFTPYSFTPSAYSFTPYSFTPANLQCNGPKPYPYCICQTAGASWVC